MKKNADDDELEINDYDSMCTVDGSLDEYEEEERQNFNICDNSAGTPLYKESEDAIIDSNFLLPKRIDYVLQANSKISEYVEGISTFFLFNS